MPIPPLFSRCANSITPTLPYRPTPALSRNKSQSCHSSSSASPNFGTKRSRSARIRATPVSPHWPQDSCSVCCHKEDDCEASDSGSDAESCCGDDSAVVQGYVLPVDHRFQEVRQPLLRLSRQNLKTFAENTQYHEPPKYQPPPRRRKRPKPSKSQSESTCLPDEPDSHSDQEHTDDGFVVVPPSKKIKYLRFSCPFYKANPRRYRKCPLQHDLSRIENVTTHVVRHHMKPSYCPICSRTFCSVIDCDRHIMARTCELRDLIMPEGINVYQKRRITERDNRQLTTTERWERINSTVFPDASSFPSPFLDRGCGRAISIARDYWREDGWRCLSDFLRRQGMLDEVQEDDEKAQVALFRLALEDLLADIMDEYDDDMNQ